MSHGPDRESPRPRTEEWLKPWKVTPGLTATHFHFRPRQRVRVVDVRLTNEDAALDIAFVRIGNFIAVRFSRAPLIVESNGNVDIEVVNRGATSIETGVVLTLESAEPGA